MIGIIKAIIALCILDSIYLKSTSTIYGKLIQKIQNNKLNIRLYSVFIVYILIFTMWVVFIYNERHKFTLKQNVIRGALLGLTTYGIFDFTNHAIFNNWNLNIVVIDTLWGSILYGLITFLAIYKFY
jgi:uncharacterized membrane protein